MSKNVNNDVSKDPPYSKIQFLLGVLLGVAVVIAEALYYFFSTLKISQIHQREDNTNFIKPLHISSSVLSYLFFHLFIILHFNCDQLFLKT